MILAATLLFSVQFVFTKCYQRERGSSFYYSMRYAALASFVSVLLFWSLNRWVFEFTPFSFLIACLYSADALLCCAFGAKTLSRANLSVYSLFLMLGGMLLPFVYGLFLGEKMTIWKSIAVAFVSASMLFTLRKEEGKKVDLATAFCLAIIFITNGLTGVLLYIHQRSAAEIVSSTGFVVLYYGMNFIFSILLSLGLYIYGKVKKPEILKIRGAVVGEEKSTVKSSTIAICATIGYALVNGTASLLITNTAKYVEAGVQSTIVTGGCMVMSALLGLFFKEKITKKTVISLIFAIIGTVCIVL